MEKSNKKAKWYTTTWFFWLLMIFVPYIGVPFMWLTKTRYSQKKKIILSVIFGLYALVIITTYGTDDNNLASTSLNNPTSSALPIEATAEPTIAPTAEPFNMTDELQSQGLTALQSEQFALTLAILDIAYNSNYSSSELITVGTPKIPELYDFEIFLEDKKQSYIVKFNEDGTIFNLLDKHMLSIYIDGQINENYFDYDVVLSNTVLFQDFSKEIINVILKAPSTAEYPNFLSSDWNFELIDLNHFMVSSYVDSQNSFGAMLRSNFTIFYKYGTDDSGSTGFIPAYVEFDGEVILDNRA